MELAKLITGPRRCGKSVLAEAGMSHLTDKIYFGTLLSSTISMETIERHRYRRGQRWVTIETSGCLIDDMEALEATLFTLRRPSGCLVDGLTTWAHSCSIEANDLLGNALKLAENIAGLLLKYSDIVWRLVDVPPEQFSQEERILSELACATIQNVILSANIYIRHEVVH